jgi:hypothetical protein
LSGLFFKRNNFLANIFGKISEDHFIFGTLAGSQDGWVDLGKAHVDHTAAASINNSDNLGGSGHDAARSVIDALMGEEAGLFCVAM